MTDTCPRVTGSRGVGGKGTSMGIDKGIYLGLAALAVISFVFLLDSGLALLAITTGLLFKWEVE